MSGIDHKLLNDFQRGFPLSPTPFADIARALGLTEDEVLGRLRALTQAGVVSRIGGVIRPHSVGASTLAAMAVPAERIEEVAAVVSGYEQVNHNYERDHRLNLWFVVTASDATEVTSVLDDIECRTGLAVLALPMVKDFYIDLGFDLRLANNNQPGEKG